MGRTRFTWVVVGGVATLLFVAGMDALRSSEIGEEVESSAELQYLERPGKLTRGRVTTGERFEPVVTFRVPPGWYGHQGAIGFQIGEGPLDEFKEFQAGGISVYVLNLSFAQAARSLEKVRGIRVRSVSPVRIGGYSGREYAVMTDTTVHLFDAQVFDALLQPGDPDPILLDVRGKTLLIRRAFTNDQDRAEIERVLMSFKFPR